MRAIVKTMNPSTKPSYSQLGHFADNAPTTAFPRGEVESSGRARYAVPNEAEAHQMSPENQSTVKPNLCHDGEGYQGRQRLNAEIDRGIA